MDTAERTDRNTDGPMEGRTARTMEEGRGGDRKGVNGTDPFNVTCLSHRTLSVVALSMSLSPHHICSDPSPFKIFEIRPYSKTR